MCNSWTRVMGELVESCHPVESRRQWLDSLSWSTLSHRAGEQHVAGRLSNGRADSWRCLEPMLALLTCRPLTLMSVRRNGRAALHAAGAEDGAPWMQHATWQMPADVLALVRLEVCSPLIHEQQASENLLIQVQCTCRPWTRPPAELRLDAWVQS